MSGAAAAMLIAALTPPYGGNDASTRLLLHGDGADDSTTFLDTSVNNFSLSCTGNVKIDTAQSVFGGASLLFGGSTDYLTIPDSPSLEIGNSSFVFEAFVRYAALPSTGNLANFISKGWEGTANYSFFIGLRNTSGTYTLELFWTTNGAVGTLGSVTVVWATPAINTWYHVAVVRSGSTVRFFVNGTQVGANQTVAATIFDGNASFRIGYSLGGAAHMALNGWLDELRLSIGTDRGWTTNFKPPARPYT